MKLSPQQKKIFTTITELKEQFNKVVCTDKNHAELIGNAIKKNCDYLLELYQDQEAEKSRLLSVNDYCIKKQNEYEIIEFATNTKEEVKNLLLNTPKENLLHNYLGGKNESN